MIEFASKRFQVALLAVVLIGFGFFLTGLDRLQVPTVDGAIRAAMAREIVENSSLYPTTYQKEVFIDHPPLYVWLSAASFKLFGFNDFAAIFPARLFGFLLVLVTFFIPLASGYSLTIAAASALILCLTREFVFASVRGNIEPILSFFAYAAFLLLLIQNRTAENSKHLRQNWLAFLAGICIFLCIFAKGPPGAWPLLFSFLLCRKNKKALQAYSLGFIFSLAIWWIWSEKNQLWPYWKIYLYEQVLASAFAGRGLQDYELSYFILNLCKFYWPWLPFLLHGFWMILRKKAPGLGVFALFGLGFVGGFSLMRWKYFYYIAPAYPAFSIVVAYSFLTLAKKYIPRIYDFFNLEKFSYFQSAIFLAWIIVASYFPIPLSLERVPEVHAFKNEIRNSDPNAEVLFINQELDHNQVSTSGYWYFGRPVKKTHPSELHLPKTFWVISDAKSLNDCRRTNQIWCTNLEEALKYNTTLLLRSRNLKLAKTP